MASRTYLTDLTYRRSGVMALWQECRNFGSSAARALGGWSGVRCWRALWQAMAMGGGGRWKVDTG